MKIQTVLAESCVPVELYISALLCSISIAALKMKSSAVNMYSPPIFPSCDYMIMI